MHGRLTKAQMNTFIENLSEREFLSSPVTKGSCDTSQSDAFARHLSYSDVGYVRRGDCDARSLIALVALAIEREVIAESRLL